MRGKRDIVVLGLIFCLLSVAAIIIGCGGSREETVTIKFENTDQGTQETQERICKSHMRTILTAPNLYAAENDGTYPTSIEQLRPYIDDFDSVIKCPAGGSIAWNFKPDMPPSPSCSIHGKPNEP